jgi:hypothetical protein
MQGKEFEESLVNPEKIIDFSKLPRNLPKKFVICERMETNV